MEQTGEGEGEGEGESEAGRNDMLSPWSNDEEVSVEGLQSEECEGIDW
jgi:hypothetical protein